MYSKNNILYKNLDIYSKSYNWINKLKNNKGYKFCNDGEATLLSTCFAVLILEGLNKLSQLSIKELDNLIYIIKSRQNIKTGLFIDSCIESFPLHNDKYNSEYIDWQTTYFAIQALDALGTKPKFPLFLNKFLKNISVTNWLENLNWADTWLESNRIMFLLSFLIYQGEIFGNKKVILVYNQILDWLEAHQNPNSGLWLDDKVTPFNAMGAAYHFVSFFEFACRPIRNIERLIDTVLSLQQEDGLFNPQLGGGACEDEEAIGLLATCIRHTSYRNDDIKKALISSFWVIQNSQNEDGGFGYSFRKTREDFLFSNWDAMKVPIYISDSWSTWLRLISLSTIKTLFPDDLPDLGEWKFRRWPALGYQRFGSGYLSKKDETLPKWIKLPDINITKVRTKINQIKPKVSIIIPCYNLGNYLTEALNSIYAQTLQTFEIIIVDDGSIDQFTQLYLKKINNYSRLRVIHTENRGLGTARNVGIQAAIAPYVCCLDADDIYMPEFLEKAYHILDTAPDIGFVSSYYQEFDGGTEVITYPHCRFPELLIENRAMVSSMFKKEAWEKVHGYSETLSALQDWDFWIRILEKGYSAIVIPEVLFKYRIRSGSMYNKTRKSENFSEIYAQIVLEHKETFISQYKDVARLWALKQSEMVNYSIELRKANKWLEYQKSIIEKGNIECQETNKELRAWINELENGKEWLNQQNKNLENNIVDNQKALQDLHNWIDELQAAKEWLAKQNKDLEQAIKKYQAELEELHNWANELQRAKEYLLRENEELTQKLINENNLGN